MLDIQKVLEQIKGLPDAERLAILKDLEVLQEKTLIQKAQLHFLDFVKLMWPSFIAGRHHAKMADAFERVARGELKRLIINMPPRHDLRLDQLVPTIDGFKKISDVSEGDLVFGPDGKPRLVTGKSPVNRKPTYRVTTTDGAELVVSEDHLWTVRFECERSGPLKTLSTKALHDRQLAHPNTSKTPKLPDMSPAEFPHRKLLIDPYVLGVWLGDGSSHGASIGCSYADILQMRQQVEDCGYKTTHNPKFQQFNVLGLHAKLRELGLLKNKHIPEDYLCSSVEQRIALLQGLIDTDGDVTEAGKVTFNQTNRSLIEQVLCLVHSLGIKARITDRCTSYNGVPSQKSYRICFKFSRAARLPRKAARCRDTAGNWARTIKIEPTGLVEETQCLQVANDDGLFMAGRGWVVTHNTKSEFASYLFPAWFLGQYPHKKVIQTAHTAELAVGFGRKVRNLIDGDDFQKVFSGISLSSDSKAAGRWNTNKGGDYFAIGVGGAVTGKGADVLVIDDPHSEQEAQMGEYNPEVYDKVYEWYTSGPRQRLQPGGAIIIVMTRWSKRDLSGQIIKKSAERRGSNEWEVIEFPAIMPSGSPLWPEFWSIDELEAIKAEIPVSKWNAQYMQDPTSEEGALLKRDWWNEWPHDRPPNVEAIIQSWDTAFLKTQRSDYSACTTWGIFHQENEEGVMVPNLILLDAFKDKMEFPELKRVAHQKYWEYEPDQLVVEKKASGAPLIAELRMMGIPVTEFTPVRGNDKIARANAVTDLFASGIVWAPPTRWAEEVIEECASFPAGEHDDYVDSVTQALIRFRQGGWLRTTMDEWQEEPGYRRPVELY